MPNWNITPVATRWKVGSGGWMMPGSVNVPSA